MASIMTLSGWGQPHDALAAIAPEATHVDYARHTSVLGALADIAARANEHDMVVGWSLGGQLAVRAIAAGMFRPKQLVLIATPFQFVATPQRSLGMKRDLYDKFRGNYARHPERTLHKAWELIHKGDTNADEVRRYLSRARNSPLPLWEGAGGGGLLDKELSEDTPPPQPSPTRGEGESIDWLHWLELLDGFSFDETHLADFPPTLLIHGDRDVVVELKQSRRLADAIPQARLMILEGCGHAPHWHDVEGVTETIRKHANV